MNFLILTPQSHPPYLYPFLGRGEGGFGGLSKFLAYSGRCVSTWTRVLKNFFLAYGPLMAGFRFEIQEPPVAPPRMGPCR